jgi:hypothetical protein
MENMMRIALAANACGCRVISRKKGGEDDHFDISIGVDKQCNSRKDEIGLRIDIDDNRVFLSTYHIGNVCRSTWPEDKIGSGRNNYKIGVEGYTNGWEQHDIYPKKKTWKIDEFYLLPRTLDITDASKSVIEKHINRFKNMKKQ